MGRRERLKIALVSPYDFATVGGVNNHISLLKENLKRMGHEVRILAPSSKKLGLDELIILGKHPIPIPSNGSLARLTFSLTLPLHVKQVIEEEKFDVIHLHEPICPFLPLYVLLASVNTPRVATFHAAKDGGNKLYAVFNPLIKKLVMNTLDERICVSKSAERNIAHYFPGDYCIIPNGVDLSHFSPSKEPKKEFLDDKINILFVGRLDDKRKGFGYLFEAFYKLQKARKDIRLLVVGAGDSGKYRKRMEAEDMENVVFVGFVPYNELPDYYRAAHMFCAPNTGNESQGIVLLEAMACGTPIVASRIPGFSGVITDSKEGLLVPPKDVDALANNLLYLIEDDVLRKKMAERNLKTAQQYDGRRVAERVLEKYFSAIEKHKSL